MNAIRRRMLLATGSLLAGTMMVLAQVKVGADVLFERQASLVQGKKVGLVTNHSAVLANGRHLADALSNLPGTKVVALFGPEHGIRGDAPDGRTVQNAIDSSTGAPVYSLYGKVNKPTPEMLKNVDVLVFDIQDVGVRFYTFLSTMLLAMEAAAEQHIPYVVLDRPDPIRGVLVEGPIRLDSMKSFVGWGPIPVSTALTVGEIATMANGEGWLAGGVKAELTVVPMEGWKRPMWYDETGLRWIKPSPNMATLKTAIVYPGTCLFEGTNLSEGRGTERPFEWIGAPYVDGKKLAAELNAKNLKGVRFSAVEFVPEEIPHVASNPKYKGQKCEGVFVDVTERNSFEPFHAVVTMLSALKGMYPEKFAWRGSIDRLAGTPELRVGLDAGRTPEDLLGAWKGDEAKFTKLREKYLLY